MNIKEPKVIKNLLSEEDFKKLNEVLSLRERKNVDWDKFFGRYSFNDPFIDELANKLVPVAREFFESDTLVPSYSLFGHYEGKGANLFRHKDDNACTYTLDMCVYQTEPWDLGVNYNGEDKYYTLHPNEALAYYGNDQEHWRNEFPNPESQKVAMIFFHYVEPDHWWFTEGPGYVAVVKGYQTEKQWQTIKRSKQKDK